MIETESNFTRWSTEDLNKLIEVANEQTGTTKDYRGNARKVRLSLDFPKKIVNLYGSDDFVSMGEFTLKIATSRAVLSCDDEETVLRAIGPLMKEKPEMPSFMKEQILRALVLRSHGWDYRSCRENFDPVLSSVARKVSIQLRAGVEAGPRKRQVVSPEQKKANRIAKLKEWYGAGGELEGPDWAWRSGHRSATGQWSYPIREQAYYNYNRELLHRENHARELANLGVKVEPYETFPDYLRRLADELEATNRHYDAYRR